MRYIEMWWLGEWVKLPGEFSSKEKAQEVIDKWLGYTPKYRIVGGNCG